MISRLIHERANPREFIGIYVYGDDIRSEHDDLHKAASLNAVATTPIGRKSHSGLIRVDLSKQKA